MSEVRDLRFEIQNLEICEKKNVKSVRKFLKKI